MPESVLWYDGKNHGIDRIKHVNELKNLKEIKWAIGGLGLKKLNERNYYDNKAEGFTGPFSDVLRVTSHMIIGFDKSSFIAICVKSMGINEIRNLVDDMGLTDAIMLDGGSLTGYNFGNYKFNTSTPQRYAIQLGG